MTTLTEQIETMRQRMHEVTRTEERLVRGLGESVALADEKLLDRVRTITVEHGARRSLILNELQALAARMGAFPAARSRGAILEDETADLDLFDLPPPDQPVIARGDWRVAASNIREQEERLERHAAGH